MSKLTLSVNQAVVARAKRYAKSRGTSISKMVEAYLSAVGEPSDRPGPNTPILKAVKGVLSEADVRDYKRHLQTKYR